MQPCFGWNIIRRALAEGGSGTIQIRVVSSLFVQVDPGSGKVDQSAAAVGRSRRCER
jgi:hypothetical protein